MSRLDVNVLPQQIVTGMQPPPVEYLICSTKFQPVCVALEIVLEIDRIWKWVESANGGRGGTSQVVVVVVERRYGAG